MRSCCMLWKAVQIIDCPCFCHCDPQVQTPSQIPDSSPQIREHFENACSYYMLLCFQKSTSGAIPQYKTRGRGQEKHTNYSFVLSSCNGRSWVLVTKNSLESKRRRKAGKTYMLDGGWYSRGLLSMNLQLVIYDSFSKQLFHRQLNIY